MLQTVCVSGMARDLAGCYSNAASSVSNCIMVQSCQLELITYCQALTRRSSRHAFAACQVSEYTAANSETMVTHMLLVLCQLQEHVIGPAADVCK